MSPGVELEASVGEAAGAGAALTRGELEVDLLLVNLGSSIIDIIIVRECVCTSVGM